ncbi:MAG: hypothetical protein IT328_05955 [Caldilineaceae bacterium]|nr:hypothetical protein [Caldilineaceae bacterium]
MQAITTPSPVTVRRQRVTFIVQSLHCDRCTREMVKRSERKMECVGEVCADSLLMYEYRCPLCGATLTTPTEYPHSHREVEIP